MKNKILFLTLLIPALIACASEERVENMFRRATARVWIDVCRQAEHKDFRLFKCFIDFSQVQAAKNPDYKIDEQTFFDVYTSEQAIDDKRQDKATLVRVAIRECLESEGDFETTSESVTRVVSCVTDKGFRKYVNKYLMAEEDARRRMLNRLKFNPEFASQLEDLKKYQTETN